MTKNKIKQEYRLAMFRASYSETYRERNFWKQKASELKYEYETYDIWEDLPINYNYNPRKSVGQNILESKSIEQIKDMIAHYQAIVDSKQLVGEVFHGARPHNIVKEHIAKLKAMLEDRTKTSSS